MKKKIVSIFGVVVLVVGVIVVILSSTGSGAYSLKIKQVQANRSELTGKELRVSGKVVKGSLKNNNGGFDHEFLLSDAQGRRLLCRYHGALPDPFKEGRNVIVQGMLQKDGSIQASQLIVKCPSKYVEKGKDEASNPQYYEQKYKSGHPTGK